MTGEAVAKELTKVERLLALLISCRLDLESMVSECEKCRHRNSRIANAARDYDGGNDVLA